MSDSFIDCSDGQSPANGARDVWKLIRSFNRQRDQKIIDLKYRKMRKNALAFFRGTCHLFYRDLPMESSLNLAPHTWVCGDLHLENFGAYKGEDRQIYFGINDFDEGVLAPCTWDITRLLTSLFLAGDSLSLDSSNEQRLAQLYLTSYTNILISGKIRSIVEDNASGIVVELLTNLARRSRNELLDERTEIIDDRRQLKFDDKILKISREQYQQVDRVIQNWAQTQTKPDFFEVLDIGFRLAGTGSLGLDRYLILVTGKGSPNRNYLLDLKQQPTSILEPYLTEQQPKWTNPATRVMTVQQLVQSAPPALLAAIEFNSNSYLLRELQPSQDKIDFKAEQIGLSDLEKLIDTMAEVTAFAHLHSSGKLGAATAQDLIDYGQNLGWHQEVLSYASNYADQVRLDYQDFYKATQDI
jgi:uncharacterized protein (DUF2252 family)